VLFPGLPDTRSVHFPARHAGAAPAPAARRRQDLEPDLLRSFNSYTWLMIAIWKVIRQSMQEKLDIMSTQCIYALQYFLCAKHIVFASTNPIDIP
jgi:hypothetical protein